MELESLVKSVKKFGLPVLAAGLVGYCTARYTINNLVAEAYEKEAKKFRSEFSIACNENNQPAVIPELFSKDEKFKSANLSDSVLRSKVGFRHSAEDKVYKKATPNAPDIGIFYRSLGSGYEFSVEDNGVNVYEMLVISNFTGELFPTSEVFINDYNHDSIPDYINIRDQKNNTQITIRRNTGVLGIKDSDLSFENVDEAGARQLFDLYSARYVDFKVRNGIDELILAYEPKVEIMEMTPENKQ